MQSLILIGKYIMRVCAYLCLCVSACTHLCLCISLPVGVGLVIVLLQFPSQKISIESQKSDIIAVFLSFTLILFHWLLTWINFTDWIGWLNGEKESVYKIQDYCSHF